MAVTPAITVTILPVRFISFTRPPLIYFLTRHTRHQLGDKTRPMHQPIQHSKANDVREKKTKLGSRNWERLYFDKWHALKVN